MELFLGRICDFLANIRYDFMPHRNVMAVSLWPRMIEITEKLKMIHSFKFLFKSTLVHDETMSCSGDCLLQV